MHIFAFLGLSFSLIDDFSPIKDKKILLDFKLDSHPGKIADI